jgi:phage terminase large subunit-like protein
VTVNADDFASEAQRAVDSPAKMVNFKARRLNVWGLNDTQTFLSLDRWLAGRSDIDLDALADKDCYGGMDLSSNTDLTSFVLSFPAEDGSIDVLAWHWLPEDVLMDRAKAECDRYPEWVEAGHLELTDGDYIDQPFIRQRINEIGKRFKIREIAYDPAFASDIGPKLAGDGFEVFEFWQTARMYTPVMAKLDELVLAGRIRHQNPMLDWQASNLLAKVNEAGHMKPAKPSGGAKIDGMSALLMSLGRIVKGSQEDEGYDYCPAITF